MVVIYTHVSDLRNFNNLAKVGRTAVLERTFTSNLSLVWGCILGGVFLLRGLFLLHLDLSEINYAANPASYELGEVATVIPQRNG